ncbi:MAG: hypothetical protein K8T90_09840 [Planctomycetes bacterium]|nr:hypothetical protein [Planctomycetota bacterium]
MSDGRLRSRRRERGHLLVWTAVFAILSMAYWALAFRATGDCIRAERATTLRLSRDAGASRALAVSVALLRTGTPPLSPYSCVVAPTGGTRCVATFTQDPVDGEVWRVDIRAAVPGDELVLPAAPGVF